MGVCTVENEKYRPKLRDIFNKEESKNIDLENSKMKRKKSSNNKIIDISLNSKKTIIKLIGEIKSKPIKIKSNIDCKILILENSQSINIENCKNCSILLAPCSSTIVVENCENLNLISASLNLKLINIKKGNIYLFSMNPIIIENCQNINLGIFFFQYTELPEMLINSKLILIDINIAIIKSWFKYINNFLFNKIIWIINIYIFIIRQEDFLETDILKLLLPDELENINVKLISTIAIGNKGDKFSEFIKKLELNKNNNSLINYLLRKNNKDGLYESLHNSILKCSSNKSRLNEIDLSNNEYMNNNYKFMKNGDLLFIYKLWILKKKLFNIFFKFKKNI